MSVNRLAKLADKFENKYRLSQGQTKNLVVKDKGPGGTMEVGKPVITRQTTPESQQIGPDPESKLKYAINALSRIVTLLEANKAKFPKASEVPATSVINLYRQAIVPNMNELYDASSQKYNVPGTSILGMKNAFDYAMQDITAATVALQALLPDQNARLETLLNNLRENIRQIQPSQVEVFNP